MKLIAILLSLCITMNVFADSGTLQELERQIDDYHYSLTVEWDQKDKAFYDAQTARFMEKMSDLIKNQGLTKEEILKLSEKKVKNKAALAALTLKMNLLSPNATAEEIVSTVQDSSKEFYSRGASWIGDLDGVVEIGILLFAFVIGYSIWFNANYECVAWGEENRCDSDTKCTAWNGSVCLHEKTTTTCKMVEVCKDWEKKQK